MFSIVPPPNVPAASAPAPATPAQPSASTPATPAQPSGRRPLVDHPDIPKAQAPDANPGEQLEAAPDAPNVEPEAEAKADPDSLDLDFDDVIDVDGKEVSIEDLLTTFRKYHTARAREEGANKKFVEAKQMSQRAVDTVKRMTTPDGFVEACQQMRVDPYEIAASIVLDHARIEKMTPEQRRAHDAERELRTYKQREQQEQEARRAEQATAQERQYTASVLNDMSGAMDSLRVPGDAGLRSDLVGRAARIMSEDLDLGYQTTPQAAMQHAWAEYRERIAKHARALPIEQRVQPQERAQLAREEAAKRVPVAKPTPAKPLPPRGDDGKFRGGFDPWNPMGNGGRR